MVPSIHFNRIGLCFAAIIILSVLIVLLLRFIPSYLFVCLERFRVLGIAEWMIAFYVQISIGLFYDFARKI